MNQPRKRRNSRLAGGDTLLAIGLSMIIAGAWLVRSTDPHLLTLWGIALLIIGAASTVTGTGILLRLWK